MTVSGSVRTASCLLQEGGSIANIEKGAHRAGLETSFFMNVRSLMRLYAFVIEQKYTFGYSLFSNIEEAQGRTMKPMNEYRVKALMILQITRTLCYKK